MFVFALIFLLYTSFVYSKNSSTDKLAPDSFFTAKLAPATLTSVPYLNGEVTVYEHRENQSRYYLPPLAILQINDTNVLYNRFTSRYSVRLALVLFTDQLHQTVLDYLRKTLNRCHLNNECQIKMIPIDRLRIVWKRIQALSDDYELDSSWMSNTILLSTIYFNIGCATQSACIDLQKDIVEHPEIIDGLELEYSTPTERHLRRDVTVTGSHVMNTNMFASLQQMQATTDSKTRYLLADDMNALVSEVIANVEMTDVTDAGYVSHDDQALMRDLIKNRIAINQEILLGHKARQWESVYWNSDNIRPDLTVKLLNEELSRQDNQGSKVEQIEIDSDQRRLNESAGARFNSSFDDASKTFSKTNDTSGSKYTNDEKSKTTWTDNQSSNTKDTSSSSATANSHQQGNSASSNSHSRTVSNHGGSSGFLFGIMGGGSRGSSSEVSSSNGNSQSSYDSQSNSNSESNREFSNQNDRNVDYQSGSQRVTNARSFRNNLQQSGSNADVRARDDAATDYRKLADMDSFASRRLDKASLGKYEENRRYLEFHGNRFEVKPVTAYRVNLGQFHETLKLVSKSIVVQRIDSIHAVPIRALGEPIILTPMVEQYKINMDQKLVELKNSVLESIQQTFKNYKQESKAVLDQTMLSTTRIINKALVTDPKNNETDTDLRFLIKKALTQTMTLHDIGLFDNGILNYYRNYATPIQKITVSSLQPLKIGLHFPNVFIEGMVCDDQFDNNDARLMCLLFHNSTSQSMNAYYAQSIAYDQKNPNCRFKTNYINELVPCSFVISSLECPSTSKTMNECKYQRLTNTASQTCQPNEHINVFC